MTSTAEIVAFTLLLSPLFLLVWWGVGEPLVDVASTLFEVAWFAIFGEV